MMRGLGYQSHHFAPGTSGATLNFNFLNDGLDPRITFTRASTGTFFNSAGVLTSAAINEARFDFNPTTLAAQGLLIEEQRTNSIRNNTMVGAVAGTPGTLPTNWSSTLQGLSQTIVGIGVEKGITYIDIRFFGITTSASAVGVTFEPQGVVFCSNGQTWAASLWISLISGSFTGITARGFSANIFDSVGAYLSDISFGSLGTITSSFQRLTPNGNTISQVGAASLRPYIFFSHAGIGTSLDFTLRIGLPQLEQGAFATSVIPTTTTALTRSADVASVNTLSPWFNVVEGSFFTEWVVSALGVDNNIAALSDGTANNRHQNYIAGSTNVVLVRTAASGVASNNQNGTAVANAIGKFAFGYGSGTTAASFNGSAVTATTQALPSSISTLYLGQGAAGGAQKQIWLRRYTFYPRKLSNAELQALTV